MTTRSVGKWKLPQPTDIKEENEWVQIPRIASTVPFGYKQNEEDPDILDPIPTELDLLEKARQHTNQYSYREVANWLSTNSGRYISHVGLRKRLQMSDSVRTKLEASASGQNMRKRQSKSARNRRSKEQAQESQRLIAEDIDTKQKQLKNMPMYCLNQTPAHRQTFLQQVNVKFFTVVRQVVVSHMQCLQTRFATWGIHNLVDCSSDTQRKSYVNLYLSHRNYIRKSGPE